MELHKLNLFFCRAGELGKEAGGINNSKEARVRSGRVEEAGDNQGGNNG